MLSEYTSIPDLTVCVDRATFRVTAPTPVILVCGGVDPVILPSRIMSFRDAFLRVHRTSSLRRFSVRLAEEVVPFFPRGRYEDILSFEPDIAQICELVVLFSESPGSFAELGAFAMDPEISARTLAVSTRWFYDQQSFIKLGPIKALENAYDRSAVCVSNDAQMNIPRNGNPSDLDLSLFRVAMVEAVTERLRIAKESTTFDERRNGHVIKLITGLIQHYGAMTLDEIELSLYCLGLTRLLARSRIFYYVRYSLSG